MFGVVAGVRTGVFVVTLLFGSVLDYDYRTTSVTPCILAF